jgi:hypothetical protein
LMQHLQTPWEQSDKNKKKKFKNNYNCLVLTRLRTWIIGIG